MIAHERSLSRSLSQSSLNGKHKLSSSVLLSSRKPQRTHTHNNSEESDYYESYETERQHKLQSTTSIMGSARKPYKPKEQSLIAPSSDKSSFSAARKEMREYVIKLSAKLKVEMGTALATLDLFDKNIKRTVDQEYARIQEEVVRMVEEVWRQSEEEVLRHVKEETRGLVTGIEDTRRRMEQMHERLRRYESELTGEDWRKAMREIVSLEIEEEVDLLIEKSQQVRNVREFKLQVSSQRLDRFENALRELLRLDVEVEGNKPKLRSVRAR